MEYSNEIKSKKTLDISIKSILLISSILFLHVYGTKIGVVNYVVLMIEVLGILIALSKGNLVWAFLALTISLTCAMEIPSFVYPIGSTRPLYSIFSMPIASIFPFYILTIVLFLISYQQYGRFHLIGYPKNSPIRKFLRLLPVMFFSGFLTGLITFLINDNGIGNYSWVTTAFFTTSLRILSLICFISTGFFVIISSEEARKKIETTFVEILFSFGIVGTLTVLLGWHGYYGANEAIMLMPLASSFCPLLILLPSFYNVKRSYIYYIVSIGFTFESLLYSSLMGSKFYLVPLLGILVAIVTSFRKGRMKVFLVATITILILVINYADILNLLTANTFVNWKFTQFLNTFSLSAGRGGLVSWYGNMDASPRFRIDEFVNIFNEYMEKPWFALFGKGNAGCIKHSWGTTNWQNANGAFSEAQISSGIYINVHESANVLFLRHGLIGLYFFVFTIWNLLKRLFKSPWALGGFIWFFFFWGVYVSWWIGAVMLVFALADCNSIGENSF